MNQTEFYLNVEDEDQEFEINVFVEAMEYSIFDFTTILTEDIDGLKARYTEQLETNVSYLRTIQKSSELMLKEEKIYVSNFHIQTEEEYLQNEFFEITLNADNIDLELCV